jgi:hypothetical protein
LANRKKPIAFYSACRLILQELIVAATRIRQVDVISIFLNQAAIDNREIINYWRSSYGNYL